MSEIALALAQELISASPAVNEEGKQVLYKKNIDNQHDIHYCHKSVIVKL